MSISLAQAVIIVYVIVLIAIVAISWRKVDKTIDPDTCLHKNQTLRYWTQDGWTSVCEDCGEWLYHGDD